MRCASHHGNINCAVWQWPDGATNTAAAGTLLSNPLPFSFSQDHLEVELGDWRVWAQLASDSSKTFENQTHDQKKKKQNAKIAPSDWLGKQTGIDMVSCVGWHVPIPRTNGQTPPSQATWWNNQRKFGNEISAACSNTREETIIGRLISCNKSVLRPKAILIAGLGKSRLVVNSCWHIIEDRIVRCTRVVNTNICTVDSLSRWMRRYCKQSF